MDYACGLGALSQRLAPYSKSIVGIDIDPSVVEQYNAKILDQGISPEEMRALCVNLSETSSELQGQLFDVIVCSQAYHHFPSIDNTTKTLASYLKPGTGTLLVSDLRKGPHAHEFHRSHEEKKGNCISPVVHHGGLTEEDMRTAFERAGLVDIDFEIIHSVRKDGREVEIFFIQGSRPEELIGNTAT
ncbi:hypothetical protein M422DRAFT_60163 [Sphaerobolus stellatus SS14]|uniref:Methyltransferase type 12 domain-containing protein n=1 Tax=Sphaerobolus stellatus (strain SS14) TaxID=990650 RepID=A0A0C9VZL0_SPHS4|nr:hypothetical protein M422DRAFT_60163 [Sphaerobolus stellatus SS14]